MKKDQHPEKIKLWLVPSLWKLSWLLSYPFINYHGCVVVFCCSCYFKLLFTKPATEIYHHLIPDLQKREGGLRRSSRLQASFWSKNKGSRPQPPSPGPSPGTSTKCYIDPTSHFSLLFGDRSIINLWGRSQCPAGMGEKTKTKVPFSSLSACSLIYLIVVCSFVCLFSVPSGNLKFDIRAQKSEWTTCVIPEGRRNSTSRRGNRGNKTKAWRKLKKTNPPSTSHSWWTQKFSEKLSTATSWGIE